VLQAGALTLSEIAESLELGSDLFKVCAALVDHACVWCGCVVCLTCNNVRRQTRHWHIQRCSGVTGEGLVDGVDWIVGDIGSRIFMMD
jgi:hypothetical protein